MTNSESCCNVLAAGCGTCELPSAHQVGANTTSSFCPLCGQKGKRVEGQTVKALLTISLRELREVTYLFCPSLDCAAVYFADDGEQVFTTADIRETVYQKAPELENTFVCYCFRHTVGEISQATNEAQLALLEDINVGIRSEQCACDLRNPQGSCCLGNVRSLIKRSINKVLAFKRC